MAANEVKAERQGQSYIISFNRPEQGNALTPDMATQLFNILKPVATDRAIRVVVLKGEGGNFMNGLDMKLYGGDMNAALEAANQMYQPYHSVIRELYAMDKPVIAAVDGHVAGSGLSIMLACDLVLASAGAKFNARFTTYGLTPDGGAALTLARKVGMSKANEILMLSEEFGAAEAVRLGLVNAVSEDSTRLVQDMMAMANKLAEGPTRAYAGIKKLVAKGFEQDINSQLALEHSYWGASARTFDFRDAMRNTAAG